MTAAARQGQGRRTRPITYAEVEQEIEAIIEELEDYGEEFERLCEEVAVAEADWNRALWRARVTLAAQTGGGGSNEKLREAKASRVADGLDEARGDQPGRYLRFRLAQERQRSMQAKMGNLRAALEGRRTQSANLRPQTGSR